MPKSETVWLMEDRKMKSLKQRYYEEEYELDNSYNEENDRNYSVDSSIWYN